MKKRTGASLFHNALCLLAVLGIGAGSAFYVQKYADEERMIAEHQAVDVEVTVAGAMETAETAPEEEAGRVYPQYSGNSFVEINGNKPYFDGTEDTSKSCEVYSELDSLGRCGAAWANLGPDLLPTKERGEIDMVRPSGWHTAKYPGVVDRDFLYNRCHLLAFGLTGENDNERNLITGTRYMNVTGMLPFEDFVNGYIHRTGEHVLYRVTPMFTGENLLADGVLMEAKSVIDDGAAVSFFVFVYNVQPGIGIDYASGKSWLEENWQELVAAADTLGEKGNLESAENQVNAESLANAEKQEGMGQAEAGSKDGEQKDIEQDYVLNTTSRKFHLPSCKNVPLIREENRQAITARRSEIEAMGYEACGWCKP